MTDRQIRMVKAYNDVIWECSNHLAAGNGCKGCAMAEDDGFGFYRCELICPVIKWDKKKIEEDDD